MSTGKIVELKAGQKAPQFSVLNQNGKKIALKDFFGQNVILYFYPKDMTPGCTTESCDFRDSKSKFSRKKSVILGISKDSPERHQKFIQKEGLNFDLLSDEDGKVCEKYGVWREKKNYGKTYMGIVRSTFIIDSTGKIKEAEYGVKVTGHVESILDKV